MTINTKLNNLDSRIQKALSFPMTDIIERYSSDYDVPMEIALEHERELKRYLIASALNPNIRYGMVGPIDNLWHTFILFTQKYTEFCNQVAGHFIHHTPEIKNSNDKETSDPNAYEQFLKDYELIFHESPPAHIWPKILTDGVKQIPGCLCCHIDHSDSSWSPA